MVRFPLHPDAASQPSRTGPAAAPVSQRRAIAVVSTADSLYRRRSDWTAIASSAHLKSIARHTSGWLIPGSTGDGWEMTDGEIRQLLNHTLSVASEVDASVLLGVLCKDGPAARHQILQLTDWLCERQATSDVMQAMSSTNVCGFTVCPPAGAHRSQQEIHAALCSILELGLPVALYQLPQVTENEMSPETVESLAQRYPNFYLLKDTSGDDRIATSSVNLEDVFVVRGAEGQYARWLKSAAGPYDGFLLSTANVFAEQYAALIEQIHGGEISAAEAAIVPVEQVVQVVFDAAFSIPDGNPFTNRQQGQWITCERSGQALLLTAHLNSTSDRVCLSRSSISRSRR